MRRATMGRDVGGAGVAATVDSAEIAVDTVEEIYDEVATAPPSIA